MIGTIQFWEGAVHNVARLSAINPLLYTITTLYVCQACLQTCLTDTGTFWG